MKLPFSTIHIPRDSTPCKAFGDFLSKQGYTVEYVPRITAKAYRDHVASQPADTLQFLWAGHWRKTNGDQWERRPNLAYMECGFYPHYSSIQIDAVGCGAHSSLRGWELPDSSEWLPRRVPPLPPVWLYAAQLEQDSVIHYDCPATCRSIHANTVRLLEELPKGKYLAVKLHPRERQAIELPDHPRLTVIRGETSPDQNADLLRKCQRFITVNSSMIYEAMIHGVPEIVALGEGAFTGHLDRRDALMRELLTFRQVQSAEDCPLVWERFCSVWRETWQS